MNQSNSSMDCLPAVVEDSEHHFRCAVVLTVSSRNLDEKQMRRGCIFSDGSEPCDIGGGEARRGWLGVGVEKSGAS